MDIKRFRVRQGDKSPFRGRRPDDTGPFDSKGAAEGHVRKGLERLQKRMGDKVTIVAVSYDDTDNAYKQFVSEHKLGFLTVHDRERKLKDLYQPTGPPETYVIDRSGKILRKFIGPQQWAGPEIVDYLQKL